MILTKLELLNIEKRIMFISEMLDFELPQNEIESIEKELDYLIKTLKISHLTAKMKEMGIKVIK